MADTDILGAGLDIEGWNYLKFEQNRNVNLLTDKSHIQRQFAPLILKSKLTKEQQTEAHEFIVSALEHGSSVDVAWAAEKIKRNLDNSFGAAWNIIIGEDFTFNIDYQGNFLYYLLYGGFAILVWKSVDIMGNEVNNLNDPKTKDMLKQKKKKFEKSAHMDKKALRDLFMDKI